MHALINTLMSASIRCSGCGIWTQQPLCISCRGSYNSLSSDTIYVRYSESSAYDQDWFEAWDYDPS